MRFTISPNSFYLFSFGIMRKEGKEMVSSTTFALILFVTWFIFGWAYLSECDKWEEDEDED